MKQGQSLVKTALGEAGASDSFERHGVVDGLPTTSRGYHAARVSCGDRGQTFLALSHDIKRGDAIGFSQRREVKDIFNK